MHFDQKEFEEYMTTHSGVMYAYIQNRVNNWATADDLLQELFIKVYKYVASGKDYPPMPLLYTMAKNMIIDHYRKQGRALPITNIETTPAVLFPIIEPNNQSLDLNNPDFWDEFSSLNIGEQEKRLIEHVILHGHTIREAAEKLGLAKSTAHDKYRTTIQLLRQYLSDDMAQLNV